MLERLFSLDTVFALSGAALAIVAIASARDGANPQRFGTALFWLVLAILFGFGGLMPYWASGLLVVALVAIDGLGLFDRGRYGEPTPAEREQSAARFGLLLFVPVLSIPLLTLVLSRLMADRGIDANAVLFSSLGLASVAAGALAVALTRAPARVVVDETRRLADAIGPAVILPQLLASVGILLTAAGAGRTIGAAAAYVIPEGNLFVTVLVVCTSMALFTFTLGNSFAAFPVIIAGIGAPLLITPYGANPALVGAMAMTAASCGTLCTPMAANFNVVPPALFEMRDRFGVIKAQAPVAGVMLLLHVVALWALIRFGAV